MISNFKPTTWKFISTFVLILLTLSCTNGEGDGDASDIPFTPSQTLQNQSLQQQNSHVMNANSSPIGKSTLSQCDPPKYHNGKKFVICRGYTTIPTDIPEKEDLKRLDMGKGGNHIQSLGAGQLQQANLPELIDLDLRYCHIHAIEHGAFDGGQQIMFLDLSHNRIETLDPEVFAGLDNLISLTIKENPLNRFQSGGAFPPLRLSTLDLSSNELDIIPHDVFKNLRELKTLNLQNNSLSRLDWRLFLGRRGILNTLRLDKNPWHCDCQIQFLIDILRDLSLTPTIHQATCETFPSTSATTNNANSISTTRRSLAGLRWDQVPTEELSCRPEIKKLTYFVYKGSHQNHDDDDESVKLGHDIHFECEYSGFPRPEVKWLKNSQPIVIEYESPVEATGSRAIPQQPSPSPQSPQESEKLISLSQSELDVNKTTHHKDNPEDDSSLASMTTTSSPLSRQISKKPKFFVQDGTFDLIKFMNEDEKQRNYQFKEILILNKVEIKDKGYYECFITNQVGYNDIKSVFMNITGGEDSVIIGGIGGKKVAIWIWILGAVLAFLIFLLGALLIFCVWKMKEKKKQEGFRKVIQEKFKDSNVDLGDLINMKTTSPHQQQKSPSNRSEGTDRPLLDNGSEHSTVLITDQHQKSQLPDVALGNSEVLRNSQIFSPKPPPALHGYPGMADARKEFFARQISEPYFRPGSAMSLTRTGPGGFDASQRRYMFANQHYPTAPTPGGEQEHQYAVPDHVRTMPRYGSAMSMGALQENDFRRQMFLRQSSQPGYATAARPYPTHNPNRRRIPSTSSEPPEMLTGPFNYSTLPRRPLRFQSWSRPVSPTGSTCSSYSTLSWRPMPNPITGAVSDGVGPRRDAGGGSTVSLTSSKTPELTGEIGLDSMNRAMMMPSNPGKVRSTGRSPHPRLGHSRTPSSLTRGHNDFFSFEPIQEVESSASNLNLEKMNGGRQTPSGYTTQSLARGEPRYKKKKPPPIAFNPATLKEPSRAFDHLKGRSISPANRNGSIDKVSNAGSNHSINDMNPKHNFQIPILESPIDEVTVTTEAKEQVTNDDSNNDKPAPPPANNRLSKSGLVPPPPPPKPTRRSQNEVDLAEITNIISSENDNSKLSEQVSEAVIPINDGTVV